MELLGKLRQREDAHDPIRVGIVGCGRVGAALAHTVECVPGMQVHAVADLDPDSAIQTLLDIGWADEDIVVTENHSEAEDAVRRGEVVVTPDALLLPRLETIEVNVEATGLPEVGALVAWHSIMNARPVVMLSVETDVTVGVQLGRLARRMGSVYTIGSGGTPGALIRLHEQAILTGFDVICLGRIRETPIDLRATAERCAEEAHAREVNAKRLLASLDGTETMIAMAAVANVTGLPPDVPGMHGPHAEIEALVETFIPLEEGGVFERRGAVDYAVGRAAPGVFAVLYSDDMRIRRDLRASERTPGPYYVQFRPCAFCALDAPQSIARAVLAGEATAAAQSMHAEVVAMAKRNLRPGERIDGAGSDDIYGRIYAYEDAREIHGVPVGVAAGGRVTREVAVGSPLTEKNFVPDASRFIDRLRKLQDALLDRERI